MTDKPIEHVLQVVRGPGKGRAFRLVKPEFTIGTAADCDMTQEGQYMSAVHAVIQKRGNDWYVLNRSPNGTFVNRTRIDTQALADGDLLQLGSEVLLQYRVVEARKKSELFGKKKKPEAPTEKKDEKPSIVKQKPGLVFGVGAYLLALVALAAYFMTADFSEVTPGLDQAEVRSAIEQTRELLQAQDTPPGRYLIHEDSDRTALFYSIISSGKINEGNAQRDKLIDELTAEIDRRFFDAWRLEKRNQLDLAVQEYESIIELAPDIRIPTTSLASRRLAYLRGVIVRG